ncbi:uncharacterized protein HD556DRAFT_524563 [Suillus plorans]|uniref:Heterokaryon incompatibility domain-containing protein n=1 Tax=Suillus plorans TaxID=116603 RepID=A0A9P7AQQ2_9AGAM|nr:uncharacterized protein HD556DRAFT_524563 [Suillus plorans]KAG1793170.1 hypothetical protein HD556DRAFT_524563 [Suillus plorans]
MSNLIPITTPLQEFDGHRNGINAVAVFPDKRRMVTGSRDTTLCLWDLKTGVVLNTMKGHRNGVRTLAVSRDGQLIASGDWGDVFIWHGETGESLTKIEAHSNWITSLDFSPDGTVLTSTGSYDKTMKPWNTKTWQPQGDPIQCGIFVNCVRYSPSGERIAIATNRHIEIYNSGMRKRVAKFKAHIGDNLSLVWTPDGTRLLTSGNDLDPTIRKWDTITWNQVGDPWTGHTDHINAIAIHPAGTLAASASTDKRIRLWRLSDRQTIAVFKHSFEAICVTFSVDGNHILSGGGDNMISEWPVPQGTHPKTIAITTVRDAYRDGDLSTDEELPTQDITTDANNHTSYTHRSKILAITTARTACVNGDLSTAEELLTQDVNNDPNNHTSYAHRSFVMARKHDWDRALRDAMNSINIEPSLTGYISKGIALCGIGRVPDARAAFDVASMYTDQDSQILHFLLLIKVCCISLASSPLHRIFQAIALFNADQYDEANLLLKELTTGCPHADTLACRVVQAYLRVEFGLEALNGARHDEAAVHFTAAIDCSNLPLKSEIHEIYEDLVVLFGWDLKSLWLTAHQKRCDALLLAGKLQDGVRSYRYMMDSTDETTRAICLEWFNAFTEKCSAPLLTGGDAALAASDFDRAIDLYSAAIDLDSGSYVFFVNRSRAKLGKRLWEEALLDAQKATELNPSSHVGYELMHTALRGAQRYDEAIEAFKIMLSKLDHSPEAHIRDLRQQYVCPSEAEDAIQRAVWIELEYAPLRLLSTSTGLLCDRVAQINAFKTSAEYNELISFSTKDSNLRAERIKDVVATYFRCVLLSHRWEETEVLLHDIQDKDVRELNGLGGIAKLQSFCVVARNSGYRWAWMDTCCIDKRSNTELQESVNSMFVWYRHSALTIVYLCDVPPSSRPGALASSVWNQRGWTFQEFVAPKVVIFYQKDWSLYLDDRSPNHKESPAIMKELEDATGIDARALISFRPGMSDARQRLQWASSRVTTLQEDVAYSLFGIFGVHLPVIYGEKKQNALGRLLQEIVARSGDITVLDWIGQPSEFNSCLPAYITSYATPARVLRSLSEDQIQTTISSLRENPLVVNVASELYDRLDHTSAARFANCRLHLPCMAFRVTEVNLSYGTSQEARYEVKADGLHDLLITTKEPIVQFSQIRPTQQTLVLVRPWDRSLLELPDFTDLQDDTESEGDYWTPPSSPSDDLPSRSVVKQEVDDLELRALRLVVRLGQPFGAFLLARQRGGEYKRVASDRDIIAQVKDVTSRWDLMDIRTIEIL